MRGADQGPNIFIMSAGHSGSTLLSMILGSHSQAIAVGELTHLPKNLALNTMCSCGTRMQQCEFWNSVIDRLSQSMNCDLYSDPYRIQLGFYNPRKVVDTNITTFKSRFIWKFRHALAYAHFRTDVSIPPSLLRVFEHANANTVNLYDVIREASGARCVIDSSKTYLKGIGLYRISKGKTKIVMLSRDGRAVLYSYLKQGGKREQAVSAWKNYYERAIPVLKRCVDKRDIAWMKYEDLSGNPDTTIRETCLWLGIHFEESMLNFRASSHHLANANRMMRRTESSGIRLDNTWQEEMRLSDLKYFEKRAGDLNRTLGYE